MGDSVENLERKVAELEQRVAALAGRLLADADRFQGRDISAEAPAAGYIYAWDATTKTWELTTATAPGAHAHTGASHTGTGADAHHNETHDHSSHTGLTDDADHPGYLTRDGTRSLTGNLSVNPNVTVDGVDLSAHVADADAHHAEAGGGVTDHQLLTNRDALLAHTQYPLRIADMIITGAWQWQNHQTYRELAAPTNPAENHLKLYAREKPTDATKIEFVFVTSQGDVVVLGEGDDTAPAAHTNILTLNWIE